CGHEVFSFNVLFRMAVPWTVSSADPVQGFCDLPSPGGCVMLRVVTKLNGRMAPGDGRSQKPRTGSAELTVHGTAILNNTLKEKTSWPQLQQQW
ncbi:MAG: hypothetical protein AAFU58_05180, partial [Pseudomonadota bacterium]